MMHDIPPPIEYADLPASETASFWLRRLERLTFAGPPSPPHRHNYQELLAVQSGHGTHQIDGQSFALAPQSVSLIGKGQVHYLEQATELQGYLVRFSDDFLPSGMFEAGWNYQSALFDRFGPNHSLLLAADDMAGLCQLLELLSAEYAGSGSFQRENSLRHLLALVLIRLERLAQERLCCGEQERESYRIYRDFIALLEGNFAVQHDVGFYARGLQVSPARLARVLSHLTAKTTKQLISERVVLEAQRFLRYTPLPVREIADQLGFSDQFQFSKAFKRAVGVAPQEFRAQRQKMT